MRLQSIVLSNVKRPYGAISGFWSINPKIEIGYIYICPERLKEYFDYPHYIDTICAKIYSTKQKDSLEIARTEYNCWIYINNTTKEWVSGTVVKLLETYNLPKVYVKLYWRNTTILSRTNPLGIFVPCKVKETINVT